MLEIVFLLASLLLLLNRLEVEVAEVDEVEVVEVEVEVAEVDERLVPS
ncbi:MAG: hypothetical protein WCJ39_08290 [bacterium]